MFSFPTMYIINILLIVAVIFFERKGSTATLAWIMVLAFIPIVGFLLYMFFNQNLSRIKINKLMEPEEQSISSALRKQIRDMDRDTYPFANENIKNWKHLIKLNHVYGQAFYTQNNYVQAINDGNELMVNLLRDIERAKDYINLEFFIFKRDYVGKLVLDCLIKKAEEGVKVRLLVDAVGSRFLSDRRLKHLIKAGGQVAYFFKPTLKIIGLKLNYRNHRKIAVIDDKVGYTGGFNIAKEYVGGKKKFGYWRDTHVRITGEAVYDLNNRFILDWRFTTKEKLEIVKVSEENMPEEGNVGIQIVSCGPESHSQEIKRAFMRMITYAEKSVYIQTPYFVPDPSILESLKMAAQSGLDVRLMLPCKPDHMFVYWATYAYAGELLKSGGKVYIYDEGFLHAKTMVVDGEIGTIGSTNFDNRSFKLNFETNAFIYSRDFAKEMEKTFMIDMSQSHQLTLEMYNERSLLIRFKEQISKLLSEIL